MSETPDKLLNVDELARRLDVGHEKVRQLAREGRIPFLMVGASMRFELAAVLAALRVGPIPQTPHGAQLARPAGGPRR